MASNCKDCGEPIRFDKLESGRWLPADPRTGKRHVCQLEQRCSDCGKPFMGAPWMKECPDCFKANRPNTRGFKPPAEEGNFGEQPARSKTRYGTKGAVPQPEPVKKDDDWFDDIPF